MRGLLINCKKNSQNKAEILNCGKRFIQKPEKRIGYNQTC